MTEQEIRDAITAYNQVEQSQMTALREIFDAIKARSNYRRVDFGNGGGVGRQWVNCWTNDPTRPYLDDGFIDALSRSIVHYDLGIE
jgi:hypothetical protein